MKSGTHFLQSSPTQRKRGIALLLVLSMLALVTMLLLASISITETDFKGETTFYDASRARLLGDSAVALAQASLVQATSQKLADGTPKPWTSQPGAIRVHGMDGSLQTIYKLYSAQQPTAVSESATGADLPANWASQKESYVDLNEPEVLPSGGMHFPIVDPRAMTNDPQTSVEGFSYENEMGAVGYSKAGPDAQRLPMPVRWIYMLNDGTLGTVDGNGIFKQLENSDGEEPSKENPIVARFAWWVDDETSKINVNTAAEGSFWDVPVADTKQERSLAMRQPTRFEYSRQPGHPAGVSLSSVLLPGRRQYPAHFEVLDNPMLPMSAEDARDLWRIGRQVVTEEDAGTSFGGYRDTDWGYWWPRAPITGVRQARYASTDELYFDSAAPLTGGKQWRQPHAFFARHPEAVDRLTRGRFFLTADSAAPEITLFGTPRIALWPVHTDAIQNLEPSSGGHSSDTPRRDTAYDHRVAKVATINESHYCVVRKEPGNGGRDLDVNPMGAPTPGTRAPNRKVFDYLRNLTSRTVPGFDRPGLGFTSFEDKYDADRDAILIEMLDYVRASNFSDGQLSQNNQFSILCPGVEHQGFGQVAPLQERIVGTPAASGNHPQGMGRVFTISEIALVIICRAEVKLVDDKPKVVGKVSSKKNEEEMRNVGDREIEVGLLVEGFVPGQGWADYRPYINAVLYGGPSRAEHVKNGTEPKMKDAFPKLQINNKELIPVGITTKTNGSTAIDFTYASSGQLPPTQWQPMGGNVGLRGLYDGKLLRFHPVVVPGSGGDDAPQLNFNAANTDANELKIALYDAPGSTDRYDLLQIIPLKMHDISPTSGSSLRLPSLPTEAIGFSLEDRISQSSQQSKPLLSQSDVVQSLAPLHGDYRVTATQRWAQSEGASASDAVPVFVPHPRWGLDPQAHSLRDPVLTPITSEPPSGESTGLTFVTGAMPDLPFALFNPDALFHFWDGTLWKDTNLEQAMNVLRRDNFERGPCTPDITGDFDNGLGNAPDGPYNNRPDDGNWYTALTEGKVPYFDSVAQPGNKVPPVSPVTFSPQRILPSPIVFGSLPTGTRVHVPWQTLLFRPAPPVTTTTPPHFGSRTPPDHLLLDLFWSPVVEPEPLGLGLETEGKINLNYQMLPFRHIKRATALHALLKAETMTAIPDSAAGSYKTGTTPDQRFRHYIDINATMRLWKERVYDVQGAFLSASQLCEHPLVPEGLAQTSSGVSMGQMNDFWEEHRLTGDNSKERPYARLYSRLTTRSNTFRVHFIAQHLKKARSSNPEVFDSSKDQVLATSRGSRILRRVLDMNDPGIPDYLNSPNSANRTLDEFYDWSVGGLQK